MLCAGADQQRALRRGRLSPRHGHSRPGASLVKSLRSSYTELYVSSHSGHPTRGCMRTVTPVILHGVIFPDLSERKGHSRPGLRPCRTPNTVEPIPTLGALFPYPGYSRADSYPWRPPLPEAGPSQTQSSHQACPLPSGIPFG